MDGRIEELRAWNCSVDDALLRMIGDEELYLEFLMEFTKEPTFDMLSVALVENRMNDAFEYSHMLKGVTANLGIDPLYERMVSLTEILRNDPDAHAALEEFERCAAAFEKFKRIMAGEKT